MMASPIPAITACLIISLLDDSMATRGAKPASAKTRSASRRVPEPSSRTTNHSFARSAGASPRLSQSRCPGGATTMVGCGAKIFASTGASAGGAPAIARSMSPAASSARIAARLPSISCTVTPGYSERNRAIMWGTMYFAVETRPSRTRPWPTPFSASIAWSASSIERSTARA